MDEIVWKKIIKKIYIKKVRSTKDIYEYHKKLSYNTESQCGCSFFFIILIKIVKNCECRPDGRTDRRVKRPKQNI